MDRYLRQTNIERFERRLRTEPDPGKRVMLQRLLGEEWARTAQAADEPPKDESEHKNPHEGA